MITGTPNTGDIINQELLQLQPNIDTEVYSHYPTNGRGPVQGNRNLILVPYQGGPMIHTMDNGNVHVRQYSSRGYNMVVTPPALIPVNSIETGSMADHVQKAAVSSAMDTAFMGLL